MPPNFSYQLFTYINIYIEILDGIIYLLPPPLLPTANAKLVMQRNFFSDSRNLSLFSPTETTTYMKDGSYT